MRPPGGYSVPEHCKPYQNEPRKQGRFEAFLKSEAAYRRLAAATGSSAEAVAERAEFGRVASFFSQRTHSVITSRFTSSEVQGPGLGATARPGGRLTMCPADRIVMLEKQI